MSVGEREAEFLERLVPSLKSQGYSVFLRPSPNRIPEFMGNYIPDAIALGKPKNLAIEVRLEGSPKKFEDLRKRFREQEDWEWRVYYVRPRGNEPEVDGDLGRVTAAAVANTIDELETLKIKGHLKPALLLSWAILEATARSLLPRKFKRPQTPGRLVEGLASDGYVTPSEADDLRNLARKRNQIIHGGLYVDVDVSEVERLLSVLKTLQRFLKK